MTAVSPSLDLQKITISLIGGRACTAKFTCGERDIDRWARDKAFKYQSQHRVRVFGAFLSGNDNVCGFYSLQFASESAKKLSDSYKEIYNRSGVPLIYIGFLAVLRSCQSCGLGTFLLIDALRRCYAVSQQVPFYGVGLRSLNERTTKLYEKYGFGAKDEEPNPLMILPVWSLYDLFSQPTGAK